MSKSRDIAVNLTITGRAYTEQYADLSSALVVLNGYEASFNQCLQIAARRFDTEVDRFPVPRIGLAATKTGSLSVKTVLDAVAIAAPLAPALPDMVKYAIELYKASGELVAIATDHFNRKQQPITVNVNVNVENSPGSAQIIAPPMVIVGNQGDVTINDENIYKTAARIHKDLDTMATQIASGDVETLSISATGIEEDLAEYPALTMTEKNRFDYKVLSRQATEDKVRTASCSVYSFNKKTGNGSLDIIDQAGKKFYPFVGVDVDSTLFVEALSAVYSTITFTSTMEVNALGEKKITRIFIHDIANHNEEPKILTNQQTPKT